MKPAVTFFDTVKGRSNEGSFTALSTCLSETGSDPM